MQLGGDAGLGAEAVVDTLLASAEVGVFILDRKLVLRAINPALIALAEVPPSAAVGRHVLDLFPLLQQLGPDVFAFVLQGRTLGGSLARMKPEQRGDRCFEVKLTPIQRRSYVEGEANEISPVTGVLGTIRDVTQERAQALRMQHVQKLGLAARLGASSAHDLSNLLTVIHAEVSCALMLCEDEVIRQSLLEIRDCAERSGSLTRDMLNFSRRNAEHPERIKVGETVGACRRMFERLLGAGVELVWESSDDDLEVTMKRGHLEQVLVNLVANARDAMPKGGKLTVRISAEVIGAKLGAMHTWLPTGRYCKITVADTGVGMPASVRTHLFEPFFTTKPEGFGVGLGLSTSRELVESAGGQLSVESEPGVGTTVALLIPAFSADARPTARPTHRFPGLRKASPDAEKGAASGNLRVVDDVAGGAPAKPRPKQTGS